MLGALNQIINLFLKNISRIVNSNQILSRFSLSLKNRGKIIPIYFINISWFICLLLLFG